MNDDEYQNTWMREALRRQINSLGRLGARLCRQCNGMGMEPYPKFNDCPRCAGKGFVRDT